LRQAGVAAAAFVCLLVIGTVGFMLLLDENVFDALFRTINTVYTAGLFDAPASTAAKAFTLFLVVAGVAIFLYVFALLIEIAVSGTVGGAWQRRRVRRAVNKLNGHYIICGYGRVGRRIGEEFRQLGLEYVVVDLNEDALKVARDRNEIVVEGAGTEAGLLAEAGIERALGLVASSDSDVDNLYITLSAKAARPDILVVARAST
jgi:voltage-gated potassium channel